VSRRGNLSRGRHQNRRETATLGASTCPTWTSTMSLNSSLRGPGVQTNSPAFRITLSLSLSLSVSRCRPYEEQNGAASRDWLHYRYARLASRRCCYSSRGRVLSYSYPEEHPPASTHPIVEENNTMERPTRRNARFAREVAGFRRETASPISCVCAWFAVTKP